jgi:hypothetical protein
MTVGRNAKSDHPILHYPPGKSMDNMKMVGRHAATQDTLVPRVGVVESGDDRGFSRKKKHLMELGEACGQRRGQLARRAHRRSIWLKRLQLTSGILALISSGSAAGLLVATVGEQYLKISATVLAFVSGIISLLSEAFLDPKEIESLHSGSNKFQILRDKITIELDDPDMSDAQARSSNETFRKEYWHLCSEYDRYLPERFQGPFV